MSSCIEAAMKYVRFGTDGLSMCNLFMVNEAEASAVYAMHSELFSLKVDFCHSIGFGILELTN
jgi:hypothetical protein